MVFIINIELSMKRNNSKMFLITNHYFFRRFYFKKKKSFSLVIICILKNSRTIQKIFTTKNTNTNRILIDHRVNT